MKASELIVLRERIFLVDGEKDELEKKEGQRVSTAYCNTSMFRFHDRWR